jgi:hypothetical protein
MFIYCDDTIKNLAADTGMVIGDGRSGAADPYLYRNDAAGMGRRFNALVDPVTLLVDIIP